MDRMSPPFVAIVPNPDRTNSPNPPVPEFGLHTKPPEYSTIHSIRGWVLPTQIRSPGVGFPAQIPVCRSMRWRVRSIHQGMEHWSPPLASPLALGYPIPRPVLQPERVGQCPIPRGVWGLLPLLQARTMVRHPHRESERCSEFPRERKPPVLFPMALPKAVPVLFSMALPKAVPVEWKTPVWMWIWEWVDRVAQLGAQVDSKSVRMWETPGQIKNPKNPQPKPIPHPGSPRSPIPTTSNREFRLVWVVPERYWNPQRELSHRETLSWEMPRERSVSSLGKGRWVVLAFLERPPPLALSKIDRVVRR